MLDDYYCLVCEYLVGWTKKGNPSADRCGQCGQLWGQRSLPFNDGENMDEKKPMTESKKCPTCSRSFLTESGAVQCEDCAKGRKALLNE